MTDHTLLEPCAFLFRSDIEGLGDYGTPARRAVLSALFTIDHSRSVFSRILEGDLLLTSIAQRTSAYLYDPIKKTSSVTRKFDKDIAKLVIWELVDSLGALDNTLDNTKLVKGLLRHCVFCIVMPSVPRAVWPAIDAELREMPAYVGAAALDSGNPLHAGLFFGSLVDHLYVDHGRLVLRAEKGAHEPRVEEWDDVGAGVVALDYADGGPPPVDTANVSQRGREGAERLRGKAQPGPREKVVGELAASYRHGNERVALSSELDMPLAVTIGRKLVGYSLNPDHPEGGHKARVFKAALGIAAPDADYLATQLIDGLALTDVNDVRMDNYGEVAYFTNIPVLGRNGATRIVHAAWRVQGDQPIRLITAYVLESGEAVPYVPDPPGALPIGLIGDEKWAALEGMARGRAERAAAATIPTPMIVTEGWDGEGQSEVIPDGECGGAYVTVKDGIKGFAGWLRRNGLGSEVSARHQSVTAEINSQSYAKAVSYATAYQETLQANGVTAVVRAYYD